MHNIEQLCRDMFANLNYCLVCGRNLEITDRRIKSCSWGHGSVSISDDMTGRPDALFEFNPHLYKEAE
jgi:hypothetical protein